MTIVIQDNKLVWDWSLGAGGPAEGFRIKYGLTAGARNNVFVINDPSARSIPATAIATLGSGPYFAAIVAFNAAGESPESNEITFDIAAIPVAPTGFRIELIIIGG